MANRYNSVHDLLKDVSEDKQFNKSVDSYIKSRGIAKVLSMSRNRLGLSQEDVAKKMGCGQAKVSKLENSKDIEFSMKDLESYCDAVNLRLEIGFIPSKATMVQRVKFHYFRLKSLLDTMRKMANGDKKMEDGVRSFTGEAFVNITMGMIECLEKVSPKGSEERQINVTPPIDERDTVTADKSEMAMA